jgi:hypothetical protein
VGIQITAEDGIMTEEEAKNKVCPYKILAWAMNKCSANCEKCSANCEASGCMMWRWHNHGAEVDGKYDANYPVEGHCGLGGKQ